MKKDAYVVLARKHRPQAFDEVVGQPAVATTLRNAIESKRVHHAYLFTGPRGVGKTTMARILAKALNCEKGPTPEPCGACAPCREIAASSCIDVLEMDAASHTGVDNVRQVIIDTVALAPSRDRYKIFIIDETHMLSTPAFNALLKTLEEPPAHVVFILATTEAAKVPATIASRCQRFKFRAVPADALAAHLAKLAAKEKISATPEALELLARSAEGSLRDAVSLLDQCRAFSDKAVTPELVREMFGMAPRDLLLGLARALVEKDAPALGQRLRAVYEEGVDPAQVLRDLRSALEEVYLEKVGAGAKAEKPWAEALASASAETVGFLLRRVNKTLEDLRFSDAPRLALELGLFGCLEAAGDLGAWVERLEALERRLAAGGAAAAPAPASRVPASAPAAAPAPPAAPAAVWAKALELLQRDKPLLAATLGRARFAGGAEPWKLLFARALDVEAAKRGQAAIEASLATAAGRPVRLALEVGGGGAPEPPLPEEPAPIRAPAAEEAPADPPEAPAPKGASPLKKAEKILGGTAKFIKKKPA